MQKKFSLIIITFITVSLLVACGAADEDKADGTKELVVSTFGLEPDAMDEDVFKPFEEEYNVKIVLETGTNAERFTRLESNPNSAVDVIELAQSHASEGKEAGLFAELDEENVQNIDDLIDSAKEIVKAGFGAAYTLNSIGIIYDQDAVEIEINDWEDLWDPSLEGKISIPDISSTFGPAMLYLASDYKGVDITEDKGEAAFEGLAELSKNVLRTYSRGSDLANMFQSGEIVAAVVGDFAVPMTLEVGDQIKYIVPESGTYANFNTVNINENSENKDLAYKYIDWRLSQDIQTKTAISVNEAPTNQNVVLDDEAAKNKTYGDVAKRIKNIDSIFVNENLPTWIDQWNRMLNQ